MKKGPKENPLRIRKADKAALRAMPEEITVDMLTVGIDIGVIQCGAASSMRELMVNIVYNATTLPDEANLGARQAILDIIRHLEDNENFSPRAIAENIIKIRDEGK